MQSAFSRIEYILSPTVLPVVDNEVIVAIFDTVDIIGGNPHPDSIKMISKYLIFNSFLNHLLGQL